MPSSGFVEVDAADNDVAMLDASSSTVAVATTASMDNDTMSEKKSREGGRTEDESPVHQVSPMPPQRVVTPKSMRKGNKDHKNGSTKSSKSSSSNVKEGESPATPPANAPVGRTSTTSSSSTSGAIGVSPGEDDGATKKKKKNKKDEGKKKPSKTLHSFFTKVDPSAKKTKTKTKSTASSLAGGAKKIAASTTAASANAASNANKRAGGKSALEELPAAAAAVEKPAAKAADNDKTKGKKKAPAKKAPAKKKAKGDTPKDGVSNNAEPSRTSKPSKQSTKSSSKPSNELDELDDSPMYAVAVALRNARGARRKSISAKKNSAPSSSNAAEVGEAVDVSDKGDTDAMEVDGSKASESANDTTDKEEASDVSNTVDLTGPVEQEIVVMDVDEGEAVVQKDSNSAENDVIDVDGEKEEMPASEVKVSEPTEPEGGDMDVDKVEDVAKDNGDANASEDVCHVESVDGKMTASQETAPEATVNEPANDDDEDDDATVSLEEAQAAEEPVVVAAVEEPVIPTDVVCAEPHQEEQSTQMQTEDKQDEPSEDDEVVLLDAAKKIDDDEVAAVDMSEKSVCAGEDSVPTEVDQPHQAEESMEMQTQDKQEEPSEDNEVVSVDATKKNDEDEAAVVDVSEKSASEEASGEEEVVAVEPPKATAKKSPKSKKKGAKQPRKKGAASSAKAAKTSKKKTPAAKKGMASIADSFKKLAAQPKKKDQASEACKSDAAVETKADTAASDTKGTSPIANSLKKLAVQPKKSTVTPTKAQSPSSTTVVSNQPKSTPASKSDTPPSKKATANKADTVDTANIAPATKLSEKDASRLQHYTTLREKYVSRAKELGDRPNSEDFQEERLSHDSAEDLPSVEKGSVEVGADGTFPDELLTHLQLIVQGRSLPLSAMAKQALDELSPFTSEARSLTIESISSKIKLLAQRKSYLSGNPPATSEKSTPISKLDCFENAEECYMWRWELSSIDLLPQKEAAKVKKARTVRKKLQGHHKAIFNLIAAIDKAATWLQNSASKPSTPAALAAGEKLIAKVSDMEEKVLKFEREEEKVRLLKEAKLQKQKSKAEELAEKQRQEEEKQNEKKRKEEEKAQKKAEAAKEREAAKKRKDEEKEQEKLKKKQQEEEKENKRKARMLSFFSKGASKKKQKVAGSALKDSVKQNISKFDSDAFWKQIDSLDEHICKNPFAKLSARSKASRRRKTNKVRISVFVTVLSENAFAPQPYDEERQIVVPNRYKFLGFHEDVRPPYRGTWSKTSKLVTGRRPLGKDTQYVDYENDSEAEWEEGDDEEGEDLQDGDDCADEEADEMQNEDDEGFIAAEDDLGNEDDDDETRELRKKNLSESNSSSGRPSRFKACVIAPMMGGIVHENCEDDRMECVIEGFSTLDAMDVLNSHVGCVVTPDVSICLDAFPPSDPVKETNQAKKDTSSQNKEMTTDDQKIMAVFVHNSTLNSREKIITELLKAHPTVTNSRAQAMRELDVIAEKRRLANGAGVLWEVKADHLKKLQLKKKDLKKPPKEASPVKSSDEGGKSKKDKDPNAPKRNCSAYILYSNATRSDVKAANPSAQFGDIAKMLSENFKALSAEERVTWDEKAAADKERYQKEMAEYTSKAGAPIEKKITATSTSPKPAADSQAKKPSSAGKKRKKPVVSNASANLFASFLAKSKKTKTA